MSLFNHSEKAYLMLRNGRIFEGKSFGAKGTAIGESVFTTSMVGYQETLTDGSYFGQIITQTFPLIGNYGVNEQDYESGKVYASGYVVREWCDAPSNFRSEGNIDGFLKKHNVIGIYDIDTRCLTRIIREHGSINAVITTENVYENKESLLKQLNEYKIKDAVGSCTVPVKETYTYEHALYDIAVLDLGCRKSILKELIYRGCNVTVYPAFTPAEEILAGEHDGILYSDGPGNPDECEKVTAVIRELNERKLASFGIGLGHILMAMAGGAMPEKLRHGHHGANQPVLNLLTGKTYVTSQNHNYSVIPGSIDKAEMKITHINGNDKTAEGISYINLPAFSVQFIPEQSGGPQNTALLYDEFLSLTGKR